MKLSTAERLPGIGGNPKRWPYVHFCPLDLGCWYWFFALGSPLRLYYKHHVFEIPGLLWLANKISDRRWDWDHAVRGGSCREGDS